MKEITYYQFAELANAINQEGMDNSCWTLVDAAEGESTKLLLGCRDDIKLSRGKYLAVWDDNGQQWLCFFSKAMATELLQGQYLILDHSDDKYPSAKIYLFKLFTD